MAWERGLFAFHAASVSPSRGVVLLAGDSAAGKSTLLAVLINRGWSMLNDDLAIVAGGVEGPPVVLPGAPDMVLWPDAAERLTPERPSHPTQPVVLRAAVRLAVHHLDHVEVDEATEASRFQMLTTIAYNSRIAALADRADYLPRAAALAATTPAWHLRPPRGRWSAEELADWVEKRAG